MSNNIPNLQIALDNTSYEDAFRTLGNGLDDAVDIIEIGTVLILSEGIRAANILRQIYPNKILVADFKCHSAHFATEVMKRDPDYFTVSSMAEPKALSLMVNEAADRGKNQKVQIELLDRWTWDDVKIWEEFKINHIIVHRSYLSKGLWKDEDIAPVKKFCDRGWDVTVAGGITYDDLETLGQLPLFAIICGRSVRNAEDPAKEAIRMKEKIRQVWG